jgi:hypothetical protein
MATRKRNYAKEYANYQGTPEQIKKTGERVKARRMMVKAGKAAKGDGKDVDHIKPIRSGGTTTINNLRMRSRSSNRSDNK